MQNGKNIPRFLASRYKSQSNMQRALETQKSQVTDAFINLRTVEREQVKNNEKSISANYRSDKAIDQRQSNLSYYDKLDEMQFTLGAEVKTADILGDKKKVVVYGVPGVGKSTLCQHLAVSWANGRMLNGKFESVVWIVLKELIEYNVDTKDDAEYLSHIIRDKCMNGLESDKPELKEIVSYIKNAGQANKVLYVLDGFDEVAQLLESKPRLKGLFEYLFEDNSFHVVLTSRRMHIELNNIERELEAVGFSKENIVNYVNKFYPSKAEALVKFINANSNLTNIAHIPLNLELMCSVLEEADLERQQNYSITQLYSVITVQLCKKMFDRENIQMSQREEEQETILNLLSGIAMHLMQTNRIQVTGKEIIALIKKQNPNLANLDILKKLLNLGVLRSVADKKDEALNSICFIHHTFTEFYAGYYIANAMNYGSEQQYKEVEKFINEHKYNPFYEVTLQYAVGILYIRAKENDDYLPLIKFWDIFEGEPRELIGIRHDKLKRQLCNEFLFDQNNHAKLQELKQKLAIVELAVDELLSKVSSRGLVPEIRLSAMDSLVALGQKNSRVLTALNDVIKDGKELGIRLYAAETILRLRYTGPDSKAAEDLFLEALQIIPKYIYDDNAKDLRPIGIYCIKAIERFGANYPTIANELVEIYKQLERYRPIDTPTQIIDRYFANAKSLQITLIRLMVAETLISMGAGDTKALLNFLKQCNTDESKAALYRLAKKHESIKRELSVEPLLINTYEEFDYINQALREYSIKENEKGLKAGSAILGAFYSGIPAAAAAHDIILGNSASFFATRIVIPMVSVMGPQFTILAIFGGSTFIAYKTLKFLCSYTNSFEDRDIIIKLEKAIATSQGTAQLTIINEIFIGITRRGADECGQNGDSKSKLVLEWANKGTLNLKLAIRLYSYSSKAFWLKPMKEITFIYKDPKILLTICNKLIMCDDEQLTKNEAETNAVLGAMREAYSKVNHDTKVFDHYLDGRNLEVSTSEESYIYRQKYIEEQIMRVSNITLGYTALHKAAEAGDLNEVRRLVEQGEIDIDDQNNESGNTPLMMAVQNRYWPVVEFLVESGADIAFCNKDGKNVINILIDLKDQGAAERKYQYYLIGKCTLKESRLEKLIIDAARDYKNLNDIDIKKERVFQLLMQIVGKRPDWRKDDISLRTYRMYLDNIVNMQIDYMDNYSHSTIGWTVASSGVIDMLIIRLHMYLELYIHLLLNKELSPKFSALKSYSSDVIKSKIYYEINLLTQTIIFNKHEVKDAESSKTRTEKILLKLDKMKSGEEIVIGSGHDAGIGHSVYLALSKINESIMLRIDNRYLDCATIVKELHEQPLYSTIISKLERVELLIGSPTRTIDIKYIRSYCASVLDLNSDKAVLQKYLEQVLIKKPEHMGKESIYSQIYGLSLPSNVRKITEETRTVISNWPYHPRQTSGGRNCTLSSYNMGISVRHGKEFYEWLIDRELESVLTLTPSDRTVLGHS